MFLELAPLLTERALFLTIAREGESLLRVNIIPKRLKENDSTETALTTPLTVIGTAAELDRDLPAELAAFTASIANASSTLSEVRNAHKAAVKEAEAASKKELDAKRKTSPSSAKASNPETKENGGPVFKDGKPVFGSKNGAGTLFDTAPAIAEPDQPEDDLDA